MLKTDKKDLDQPVTRGEFIEFVDFVSENMMTKADLKGVATKLDLEGMATKAELRKMASKLDLERLERKVDGMENKMTDFRSDILTAVDKVLKVVQTNHDEDAAHRINHRDITNDVLDLKKRTSRLEAHAGIS